MPKSSIRGRAPARRRAVALVILLFLSAGGCALIPTLDDVHSASKTVKDTVSGKARRDRQTQTYAEARILERRKDFAGAEKMYREVLAEVPQSRDCYHRLAVMSAVQGKFNDANAHYQTALKCGQPTADLWSDIGYYHYLQQQLPEAHQAYHQALALEPQHRAALNNLALVTAEMGNLDESYRLFCQANKEAEAEANFAFACAQCGDLQRAQMHYSRALSYDPEMRTATAALVQVTQRMQMQLDQQSQQQRQPGAVADGNAPSGVQLVSHEEPQTNPSQRPLIEVFTPTPRRQTGAASAAPGLLDPSATNTVTQLAAAQAAGRQPTPAPVSYHDSPSPVAGVIPGFPQPQSAGRGPGMTHLVPQPNNFPSQAQPQYLQPSSGPPSSHSGGGAPGNHAAANMPGGPVQHAGGNFPTPAGGAPMMR